MVEVLEECHEKEVGGEGRKSSFEGDRKLFIFGVSVNHSSQL